MNVDSFRPEVRSDVMSMVVVGPTGVKVRVKFGDSRSNSSSRDIGLPHFVTNDDDDAGVCRSSHKGKTAFCLKTM